MPQQYVQKEKKQTKRASELMAEQQKRRQSNPALAQELDTLLTEIDNALQGVDQKLAEKYVQQGGE